MIETAGADVHAAAAMTDTDHAAPLTIAVADDLRVLESEFFLSAACQDVFRTIVLRCPLIAALTSFLSSGLADECVEEEEAGAARKIGTTSLWLRLDLLWLSSVTVSVEVMVMCDFGQMVVQIHR